MPLFRWLRKKKREQEELERMWERRQKRSKSCDPDTLLRIQPRYDSPRILLLTTVRGLFERGGANWGCCPPPTQDGRKGLKEGKWDKI